LTDSEKPVAALLDTETDAIDGARNKFDDVRTPTRPEFPGIAVTVAFVEAGVATTRAVLVPPATPRRDTTPELSAAERDTVARPPRKTFATPPRDIATRPETSDARDTRPSTSSLNASPGNINNSDNKNALFVFIYPLRCRQRQALYFYSILSFRRTKKKKKQ
jgi:hypothetical protein